MNELQVKISGYERRQVLGLVVLTGAFFAAYAPTWFSLVGAWASSDDYSHGFFILPLSLFILWKNRELLQLKLESGHWSGLILALSSLLVYLFSIYAEVLTLSSVSMIFCLAGAVLYLFGAGVLRQCLFPLTLLLFMIPVPSQIYSELTIPLQLLVSKVTVMLVSFCGVPVLREGNVIQLPQHTLQVVQACSGLRSIMTLLTLGAVMGYFSLHSNLLRWILFSLAIPIAIAVNILRVMIMVLAIYLYSLDLTEGTLHTMFGLFVFCAALVLFFSARKVLALWDR